MVNDPIGDLLTRIKNAGQANHSSVSVPYSKLKWSVAKVLEKEGYIKYAEEKGKGTKKFIEVGVMYIDETKPRINGARRVSKPSRRIYKSHREIQPVKYGHGTTVISTPAGIKTDKEAKEEKVGGEALFEIW